MDDSSVTFEDHEVQVTTEEEKVGYTPDKSKEDDSPATIDVSEVRIVTEKDPERYGYNNDVPVTTQPTDAPPIVSQPPRKPKPKDFVVTSCVVVLVCNFCFGLLGYHYGVKANYAWQLGDEDTARQRAKMAKVFVIFGIIAGIATYALALGLFFGLNY